jgi:hypothetical protein
MARLRRQITLSIIDYLHRKFVLRVAMFVVPPGELLASLAISLSAGSSIKSYLINLISRCARQYLETPITTKVIGIR